MPIWIFYQKDLKNIHDSDLKSHEEFGRGLRRITCGLDGVLTEAMVCLTSSAVNSQVKGWSWPLMESSSGQKFLISPLSNLHSLKDLLEN